MNQGGTENTAGQGTAGSPVKKKPRRKVRIILTIMIALYYTVLYYTTVAVIFNFS